MKNEKTFRLAPSDFNTRFDKEFHGFESNNYAGGRSYKSPKKPWKGYGLNIGSPDQAWIGTGEGSWCVAYHGIGGELEDIMPKIVKGNLRPGVRNRFTDHQAIYCTPDFDKALHYAN